MSIHVHVPPSLWHACSEQAMKQLQVDMRRIQLKTSQNEEARAKTQDELSQVMALHCSTKAKLEDLEQLIFTEEQSNRVRSHRDQECSHPSQALILYVWAYKGHVKCEVVESTACDRGSPQVDNAGVSYGLSKMSKVIICYLLYGRIVLRATSENLLNHSKYKTYGKAAQHTVKVLLA